MLFFNSLLVGLAAVTGIAQARNFTNPLKDTCGCDPFIVSDGGYYYLTYTSEKEKEIFITRATTLEGLKRAGETKRIWYDESPWRCCHMWAPEIHKIDDNWYVYYSAGWDFNATNQRNFVLTGGKHPWDDVYTYGGILGDENKWAIDGTVAKIGPTRYFIWSCHKTEGVDSPQLLCIAPMVNATALDCQHVSVISRPERQWECEEGKNAVNEAPAVLQRDGRVFITFSASYCNSPFYQLGLLTLNEGQDPTKEGSWAKSGPVFYSANGNYGTGHNGFFKSLDGREDWHVFHATTSPTGACDGTRYTMAQKVNWTSDGTPDFGNASWLNTTLEGPSGELV